MCTHTNTHTQISSRIDPDDPTSPQTTELTSTIHSLCQEGLDLSLTQNSILHSRTVQLAGLTAAVAMGVAYWSGYLVS